MNLSEHFTDKELACRCARHGGGLFCNVAPELLKLAETVRAVLGVPMVVTSCCRCPAHNAEEGGVKSSKHLCADKQPARAMDFKPQGVKPLAAYRQILAARKAGKLPDLGGIGLYDTFLHIDTEKAPDGHLRTWDYRKRK